MINNEEFLIQMKNEIVAELKDFFEIEVDTEGNWSFWGYPDFTLLIKRNGDLVSFETIPTNDMDYKSVMEDDEILVAFEGGDYDSGGEWNEMMKKEDEEQYLTIESFFDEIFEYNILNKVEEI